MVIIDRYKKSPCSDISDGIIADPLRLTIQPQYCMTFQGYLKANMQPRPYLAPLAILSVTDGRQPYQKLDCYLSTVGENTTTLLLQR